MQTVLKKPAAGEPCNGCGYCCTEQLCQLAVEFLGCSTGPCLALEERGGRTLCGLVLMVELQEPSYAGRPGDSGLNRITESRSQ